MIWYFSSHHVLWVICKYILYLNAPVWEPPFNLYSSGFYYIPLSHCLSHSSPEYIFLSLNSLIFLKLSNLYSMHLSHLFSHISFLSVSLSQIILSLTSNVWFWAWWLVWVWSRLHRPRRLDRGAEWLLFFGLYLWTWGWSHLWNCFRQVHLKLYFILLITIFWLLLQWQ